MFFILKSMFFTSMVSIGLPRTLFFDLGPMYATDRQTDVRQKHRLMPRLLGAGHNKLCAWRHNMPPPPASLTIISCKYENRQRLQFTN